MAHTFLQVPIWEAIEEGESERDSKGLNVLSSSEVETSCAQRSPSGLYPQCMS